MASRRFGTALSVSPADEMRGADNREGKADARTGAKTKRCLDMLDRKVRLPSHHPDAPALEPPARKARVKRQRTIDQHHHGADVLAEHREHDGRIRKDCRIVTGRL